MIDLRKRIWGAAAAVALAQTLALGWIVVDRIQLLRKGQEIVLPVEPVDPRSLFRGDYVILSLPVRRIPGSVPGERGNLKRGEALYVTLERNAAGDWAPAAAGREPPKGEPSRDRVVLKARMHFVSGTAKDLDVRYGLESYFVPEGKGKELEKLVGKRQVQVMVAVDRNGNSAIKGLVIDGKRIYDEPLI